MASAYEQLERLCERLGVLSETIGLLHWDMSTMMPADGAEARGGQLAALKGLHHELMTAPQVGEWLDEAESRQDGLNDWQRANLREFRREYVHATAVPGDLVEATSRAVSACEMTWREARAASDFAAVAPLLAEVLNLIRQTAQAKAAKLGCSLYDALLDEYEPGGRSAEIDEVFADLEAFLPGFLGEVLEHQGAEPPAPKGPFPAATQKELGRKLMGVLGFDFERGRLDESFHPFCGGIPDDIRMTTRYDEDDFTSAIMGVLHETGHALYEQGLPKQWRRQPVGQARGMSLHESQSLLMEMQACRSREFMTFAAPLMRQAFGGSGPEWEAESLYRRGIRVQPDFIRVDADEVTYPAHVILRYRLEKALIAGEMEVNDLPGAWSEGMKTLLGITPPDDRRGCLQDIHWFDGAWGYFPTYTLGAMTATQLFDAARRDVPSIPESIGRGDFGPLLTWLRANVHEKGSLLSTRDLLTQATGRPLDPQVFKDHLRRRYLA
ncbi:carboxypeptidase M32 [Telmatospirillum sp. J64-1]|uniref:carboxypeptidase M32 n=1 Tax=Telmatospirillum sp. J64-1 TaxID=2502183 RepID=UPI00115D0F1F|nr:carboxypeptidase M32 [Telmatospirillum sp. J64-1]